MPEWPKGFQYESNIITRKGLLLERVYQRFEPEHIRNDLNCFVRASSHLSLSQIAHGRIAFEEWKTQYLQYFFKFWDTHPSSKQCTNMSIYQAFFSLVASKLSNKAFRAPKGANTNYT